MIITIIITSSNSAFNFFNFINFTRPFFSHRFENYRLTQNLCNKYCLQIFKMSRQSDSKTFVFHMLIHNVWQWNVQITDTVKTKHFKPNSSRTDNVELKQTTARVNLSVFKQNNRGFAFLRWNSSMLTIQTQINMRSIPESLKLFVHLVPFWSRNGPVSSK